MLELYDEMKNKFTLVSPFAKSIQSQFSFHSHDISSRDAPANIFLHLNFRYQISVQEILIYFEPSRRLFNGKQTKLILECRGEELQKSAVDNLSSVIWSALSPNARPWNTFAFLFGGGYQPNCFLLHSIKAIHLQRRKHFEYVRRWLSGLWRRRAAVFTAHWARIMRQFA